MKRNTPTDDMCWIMMIVLLIVVLLTGCNGAGTRPSDPDIYVYKYNTLERKWDLADPESRLKYNVFEREWQFAR